MGFFSQDCKTCEREVMAWYAYQDGKCPIWMVEAVVITPDGKLDTGFYDGYGRLMDDDGMDMVNERESGMAGYPPTATVYHKACWEIVGRPREFAGVSPHAKGQGFFTYYPPSTKPQMGRRLAKAAAAKLLERDEHGTRSLDGRTTPARGFLSTLERAALERLMVAR